MPNDPVLIPGYRHRDPTLAPSPVTEAELAGLRKVLLLGAEDEAALRRSAAVLAPQVDAILDVWYGFVASTPELVVYFGDAKTGAPLPGYLAAVRPRFGQWILDTAAARFDAAWLAWQHEIGLRHSRHGKNRTDGVASVPQVHWRWLVALVVPLTATLKPFLADPRTNGGATAAEVDAMHAAWLKAVLLQVILWSRPYVHEGEF